MVKVVTTGGDWLFINFSHLKRFVSPPEGFFTPRLKRFFRYFLVFLGFGLVVSGLFGAYWWWYKLVPQRNLADPKWVARHSELIRWKEEEKDYHRTGSSPDLFFQNDRIGYYGGKEWFLWLEKKLRGPGDFRNCGCTSSALTLMANQHVSDWEPWVRTNRTKTQEEWIKDGFVKYGVTVRIPPTEEETVPLLRLLGRPTWQFLHAGPQGTNAPKSVPSYVKYNAFRWLRDSGFSPLMFAKSNATMLAEVDLTRGLLMYSDHYAVFPGRDGLGVLALMKKPEDIDLSGYVSTPPIAKPLYVVIVNSLIVFFVVGGVVMIRRFVGNRGRNSF